MAKKQLEQFSGKPTQVDYKFAIDLVSTFKTPPRCVTRSERVYHEPLFNRYVQLYNFCMGRYAKKGRSGTPFNSIDLTALKSTRYTYPLFTRLPRNTYLLYTVLCVALKEVRLITNSGHIEIWLEVYILAWGDHSKHVPYSKKHGFAHNVAGTSYFLGYRSDD